MSLLQWTKSDFELFLGGSQSYVTVQSNYPWLTLSWTQASSIQYGAGVMQFPCPNYDSTQWENDPVISNSNYFHWDAWENVIQLALSLGLGSTLLLNDGGSFQFNDQRETVTLMDYIQYMLAPRSEQGTVSQPWSINEGHFNPDRLLCRQDNVLLPLPYQQSLYTNQFIGVFPVLPPRGYASVGHFILASQSNVANPSGEKFRSSPTQLLFIKKDQRFVQPPIGTTAWPGLQSKPLYYNQRVGTIFQKAIQQLNLEETASMSTSYIYSCLGNFLFNGIVTFPSEPDWHSYPSHFPWAVNLQLVRFFPNGPDGDATRFQTLNVNRLISVGIQNGITGNNQTTPTSKIVNPLYSTTFFYPVENGYSGVNVNLSFSPGATVGQRTWPLIFPFGIQAMLLCCTGQYLNSTVVWDWGAFPPYPNSVTDRTLSTSQAICKAGGYSFEYRPGGDCNSLTSSYCHSSFPQYNYSNCICYNPSLMLSDIGLCPKTPPCPPSKDPNLEALKSTLSSNIACVYEPCSKEKSALKNTGQVPLSGVCPTNQLCVISGNTFYGDNPELINNCSANGTQRQPRLNLNVTVQSLLFAAAILFVVIGGTILLLRIRKRRKSDKEADKPNSQYDLYDDDEDLPSEYSHAFASSSKKKL